VVEKLDFDASPEALRGAAGRDFGVIHIAAHTVLDSRRPELSGIVLSLVNRKGEAERGILRLRELYDLRLQTGLVTLSACETGIGKEAGGEGMLGISHAFLYAGARRVVASLWKVEDTATATMMQHFYRAIYQQHLTPAAALYAAQTAMRSDPRWAAPYYWASFVLEGEWR
jgi:CHAT domain-containing protein